MASFLPSSRKSTKATVYSVVLLTAVGGAHVGAKKPDERIRIGLSRDPAGNEHQEGSGQQTIHENLGEIFPAPDDKLST